MKFNILGSERDVEANVQSFPSKCNKFSLGDKFNPKILQLAFQTDLTFIF